MKKFVIASVAVVVVLAGSAVFAHDHSMPSMEHHGMQSMKSTMASCQEMMGSR